MPRPRPTPIAATAYWASWCLLAVALILLSTLRPLGTPYLLAWAELSLIFLGFKGIVLASYRPLALQELGLCRLAGFVFAWPGMDLRPFLQALTRPLPDTASERLQRRRWSAIGLANILSGVLLFWLLGQPIVRSCRYLYAGVGLASVALIVLFGLFTLLAVFWRWRGVDVDRQWKCLWLSRSLGDYWSNRWNQAFHDFARDHVYLPLKRRFGRGSALLGSFLFSGILHDVIVSIPAGGGYGMPTCYFLLQGLGIWLELRWRLRPALRWLLATAFVLGPLPLLFHEAFLTNVILPQLSALRGDGAYVAPR